MAAVPMLSEGLPSELWLLRDAFVATAALLMWTAGGLKESRQYSRQAHSFGSGREKNSHTRHVQFGDSSWPGKPSMHLTVTTNLHVWRHRLIAGWMATIEPRTRTARSAPFRHENPLKEDAVGRTNSKYACSAMHPCISDCKLCTGVELLQCET